MWFRKPEKKIANPETMKQVLYHLNSIQKLAFILQIVLLICLPFIKTVFGMAEAPFI